MRLGIVASEFFAEGAGPMGGFGWAARQVATLFKSNPDLGVDVVFLAARPHPREPIGGEVHRTPIIFRGQGQRYRDCLRRQHLDLLLTVDYRPRYGAVLDVLNHTPVLVWVRDPRSAALQAKVSTLRLPEDASAFPQGIKAIDCRSLSAVREQRRRAGRPMLFATPAPSLASSLKGAYGISGVDCVLLPNIVDIDRANVAKSASPRAIFLGRLDPIKRPWLFVDLARMFPAVEFLMLGQSHFRGRGSWRPAGLPDNVTLLGHVDGEQKVRVLASAWVLVNTSIHEALPTSVLEALACETPILSLTDREQVASRFGICAGWIGGEGSEGLSRLADGLRRLLEHDTLRTTLGRAGKEWVQRTHSAGEFLRAFDRLCARAGVRRATTSAGLARLESEPQNLAN